MITFLTSLIFSLWGIYLTSLATKTNCDLEKDLYFSMALFSGFVAFCLPARNLYIGFIESNKSSQTKQLQLQNDSLTRIVDSLRQPKPCPDTTYIFLPPTR